MKFVVVFIALIFNSFLFAQEKPKKNLYSDDSIQYVDGSYELGIYMRFRITHYLFKNHRKIDCSIIDRSFDWYKKLLNKLEKKKYPKENFLDVICEEDPKFCPYYSESKKYWKMKELDNFEDQYSGLYGISLVNPYFPSRYNPKFINEMIAGNPVFEDIYSGQDARGAAIDIRNAEENCLEYVELMPLFKMIDVTVVKGEKFNTRIKEFVFDYSRGEAKFSDLKKEMAEECEDFNSYAGGEMYAQTIHEAALFCATLKKTEPEKIFSKFCNGKYPFLCIMKSEVLNVYKSFLDWQKFYPEAVCTEMLPRPMLCY